jgi:hypothetical protein
VDLANLANSCNCSEFTVPSAPKEKVVFITVEEGYREAILDILSRLNTDFYFVVLPTESHMLTKEEATALLKGLS